MSRILILYATREGQARRIAEHLASEVQARGLDADVIDARALPEPFVPEEYDAAIVCASVHAGHHEKEIVQAVRDQRSTLERMPSAFVSVSLSQAGAEDPTWSPERRAQAAADTRRMIDEFLSETGWRPEHTLAAAGALRYGEYNWLLRLVMKQIARKAGAPTDASRDYEFTDWKGLDRLAQGMVSEVRAAAHGVRQ